MLELSGQVVASMLGLEWSALGPLSQAMYSEIAGKINASILAPLQGLMHDQSDTLQECHEIIKVEWWDDYPLVLEIEALQARAKELGTSAPVEPNTLALREQVAALRQVLTIHRNKLAADQMSLFLDEKAKSLLKETDKVLEGTKQ